MRPRRGPVPVDGRDLASVLGGRAVTQSGEMDPTMLQAFQGLIKAVKSIGDARKAAQQQNMQQVMQFVMHAMDGGGGGKGGKKK
jgi:hypothetical protein